mmetsp:Transcript_25812/g.76246  ORF Transcript_25812/g.76246 Transcript_25812/m.76246 type:complete len:101 (-) Transcript_25812:159-461(-)
MHSCCCSRLLVPLGSNEDYSSSELNLLTNRPGKIKAGGGSCRIDGTSKNAQKLPQGSFVHSFTKRNHFPQIPRGFVLLSREREREREFHSRILYFSLLGT